MVAHDPFVVLVLADLQVDRLGRQVEKQFRLTQ
jgi:hypothetical protein